jgi:HSP20 family protein
MAYRLRGSVPQLQQVRDEVDRLFSNLVAHPSVVGATRLVTGREFPPINLSEDTENLYAECELPGVLPEDLDISVAGIELTVKGRRSEQAEPQATFHRRERGAGSFTRVVQLTSDVAAHRVSASLRDGILLVTLPKSEGSKPRKVQVQNSI